MFNEKIIFVILLLLFLTRTRHATYIIFLLSWCRYENFFSLFSRGKGDFVFFDLRLSGFEFSHLWGMETKNFHLSFPPALPENFNINTPTTGSKK